MNNIQSVCRICRKYKTKLFLKGDRCNTPKCALTKRPYGPGIHGQSRHRMTEYAIQLAEKQKAKAIYSIREKQFKNYYLMSVKSKSNTSEELLRQLELRFDSIVYRLGFASSRLEARQMIRHNKFLINNKKTNIPSYTLKAKDIIKPKNSKIKLVKTEIPVWLSFDKKQMTGEVIKLPERKEMPIDFSDQLIVEFYSR